MRTTLDTDPFNGQQWHLTLGNHLHLFLVSWDGRRTPHISMDSSLEAFSGNPTDGSFTALVFQPAVLTKYLNELFLSYWVRLLSRYPTHQ